MVDQRNESNGFACGVGGFSPRGLPLPMVCPTAYPELWEKSRRTGREQPSRRPLWGNSEPAQA